MQKPLNWIQISLGFHSYRLFVLYKTILAFTPRTRSFDTAQSLAVTYNRDSGFTLSGTSLIFPRGFAAKDFDEIDLDPQKCGLLQQDPVFDGGDHFTMWKHGERVHFLHL